MSEPTILAPDEDPMAALLAAAQFVSDGRGLAEIVVPDTPPGVHHSSAWVHKIIGLMVLCKQPEDTPVPVYDVATRALQTCLASDWLRERGYEASACRWVRKTEPYDVTPGVAWQLQTGRPVLPALRTIIGGDGGVTITNRGSGYTQPVSISFNKGK